MITHIARGRAALVIATVLVCAWLLFRPQPADKGIPASREAIFVKLREFRSDKDVVAYIDGVLPTVHDPDMVWRLEYARQIHLEWDGQYDAALENARRLLATAGPCRFKQEHLQERIAFNLMNLGRYGEAAAQIDELLTAAGSCPEHRRAWQAAKEWCLTSMRGEGADSEAWAHVDTNE